MGAFRNIAATMVGTRIAAEAKSTGLIGVVAGLAVTRIMARSPLGALVIGGGYIAHKLLQKKQKVDLVGPHDAAIDDGLVDRRDDSSEKSIGSPAPNPTSDQSPDLQRTD